MKTQRLLLTLFLTLLLILTFNFASAARSVSKPKPIEKLSGIALNCHDGDTCRVKISEKETRKIRLAGIDAPEIKQPFGKEAQAYIEKLIKDKKVELECEGMSFDRHTCRILLGPLDVGREMVLSGLAWDSPLYSKKRYTENMTLAKTEKKGLWREPSSVSPYCFRKPTSKHCKNRQEFMP